MRLMSTSKDPDDFRDGAWLTAARMPGWLRRLRRSPDPPMPRALEAALTGVWTAGVYLVLRTMTLPVIIVGIPLLAAGVSAAPRAWERWQRRRPASGPTPR